MEGTELFGTMTTLELCERQRQEATALAESRQDYYISVPGPGGPEGPLSERVMRERVYRYLSCNVKPVVLKVTEVYE